MHRCADAQVHSCTGRFIQRYDHTEVHSCTCMFMHNAHVIYCTGTFMHRYIHTYVSLCTCTMYIPVVRRRGPPPQLYYFLSFSKYSGCVNLFGILPAEGLLRTYTRRLGTGFTRGRNTYWSERTLFIRPLRVFTVLSSLQFRSKAFPRIQNVQVQ